jgi:queuosine precursor transporter
MIKFRSLYSFLVVSFAVIVVLSNILSAKMVLLSWISLTIPAGLLIYPITFFISALVTELFGIKRAKFMVYLALAMCLLSFGLIQLTLLLPTDSNQIAFEAVLGLSGLRIFSSLIAYLCAQIVDIQVYAAIKRWTGSKWLWLRNNGSTCLSQLIDTLMIDLIYLWWGCHMPFKTVVPIMVFSIAYKAFFSIAGTPLFYFLTFALKRKGRIYPLILK